MQNKKIVNKNSHQFAFYYENLSNILLKDIDITIICDDLYHRFKNVLRMKQDDQCIIFNRIERITFIFTKLEGKNRILGSWKNRKKNEELQPKITFILPLLKIDALSESVYSLAEVGVTNIQLILTDKTQMPYSEKLFDKLQRVVIAAAEQSKMYAFPKILPPIILDEWLSLNHGGLKFYFDIIGISFAQWYKPIDNDQHYYLLVGPEGDFTQAEKDKLYKSEFVACLLTSTVLRSVRSVSLVSGLFRL
jgi:16S rRNA (uracil1498-N3)-methyltransferase